MEPQSTSSKPGKVAVPVTWGTRADKIGNPGFHIRSFNEPPIRFRLARAENYTSRPNKGAMGAKEANAERFGCRAWDSDGDRRTFKRDRSCDRVDPRRATGRI